MAIQSKLVEWRRYLHQHPELSNREYKTGEFVADHLKALGLEVKHPVAKTGVVAVLKGAKPGPVIALRADMDALPIKERVLTKGNASSNEILWRTTAERTK